MVKTSFIIKWSVIEFNDFEVPDIKVPDNEVPEKNGGLNAGLPFKYQTSENQTSKSLLFRFFSYPDVHYSDPHCYETIQSGQATLRRRCINAGALCFTSFAFCNITISYTLRLKENTRSVSIHLCFTD